MFRLLLTIFFSLFIALIGDCQEVFVEHQSIFTYGANDFKSFVIEGETYLAVAHFTNNNSEEISSSIYHWQNDEFQLFQEILTAGASDWEFFEIDGVPYLAVANYEDDESNYVNSVIYRWSGTQFNYFQNIPTVGAYDWEFFEIEETPYLVVANQTNGESNNINSVIYQWDGSYFQEYQSIPQNGATDWESFILNGENYLAVANVADFITRIYKWNGIAFEPFQNLLFTLATTGVESFVINDRQYLAMSSGTGTEDYNSISKIFVWQETAFVEFQNIETRGAFDWEYFSMNSEDYLVIANYKAAEGVFTHESEIFKWNGSEFESFQTILTYGAVDWEYCEIEEERYLMVAEYKNDNGDHNINSRIFRFDGNSNVFVSNLEEKSAINIYPNPVKNTVNIIITDDSIIENVSVFNLEGKNILNSKSREIEVDNLASGGYLIQVTTNKTTVIKSILRE